VVNGEIVTHPGGGQSVARDGKESDDPEAVCGVPRVVHPVGKVGEPAGGVQRELSAEATPQASACSACEEASALPGGRGGAKTALAAAAKGAATDVWAAA